MTTVLDLFEERRKSPDAMTQHMDVIRKLADDCDTCAEIGIRRASSTLALLASSCEHVWSCDIEQLPQHDAIAKAAGKRWRRWYVPSESWEWPHIGVGLLCIDGYHTYSQVKAELDRFADQVGRYLVFHDTLSCGIHGGGIANRSLHESPHMSDTRGIRLAVDELMIRDPSWFIQAHYANDAGLLVLERRA